MHRPTPLPYDGFGRDTAQPIQSQKFRTTGKAMNGFDSESDEFIDNRLFGHWRHTLPSTYTRNGWWVGGSRRVCVSCVHSIEGVKFVGIIV